MNLQTVKTGLILTLILLTFGIFMGIGFGVAEDSFKDYVSEGIAQHPELHDEKSPSKIWRYAQRAHFHATGIGAFSLALILLVCASSLKLKMKKYASTLIGLSGLYPLAWLSTYLMAPSLGRSAAHHHIITETLTYIGTGGLLLGLAILMANITFSLFEED